MHRKQICVQEQKIYEQGQGLWWLMEQTKGAVDCQIKELIHVISPLLQSQ